MIDFKEITKKVGDKEVTLGAVLKSDGSTTKNKTGGWRAMRPVFDHDKCIACGQCWQFCPDNAIDKQKDGKFDSDYDYCKGCGICARICPAKAITMEAEEK